MYVNIFLYVQMLHEMDAIFYRGLFGKDFRQSHAIIKLTTRGQHCLHKSELQANAKVVRLIHHLVSDTWKK